MKKLPTPIYVFEDKDWTLVASRDSHEQTEGIVGIYDLREMIHIRHKAQFRRLKSKAWFDKG